MKLLLPPYTARMEWVPKDSDDTLNVATPLLRVADPKVIIVPSRNVTVPVTVPEPGDTAVTVAVKVTDWLKTEGSTEELSVADVMDWLTFWVTMGEVLPLKTPPPPYVAVKE